MTKKKKRKSRPNLRPVRLSFRVSKDTAERLTEFADAHFQGAVSETIRHAIRLTLFSPNERHEVK